MGKTSQEQIIINARRENPDRVFTAVDFQKGQYFIGYEASARMSDVMHDFPEMVIVGREGIYRTLQWNKDFKEGEE